MQDSTLAEMLEEMQRQSMLIEVEDVEEGCNAEVDPFNLFNWSSSSSSGLANKVSDVSHGERHTHTCIRLSCVAM